MAGETISRKVMVGKREKRTHELRVRVEPVAVPPPIPAWSEAPSRTYDHSASALTTVKPATWHRMNMSE